MQHFISVKITIIFGRKSELMKKEILNLKMEESKFNIYLFLKQKGYSGIKSFGELLNWLWKRGVMVGFDVVNPENEFYIQCSLRFIKNNSAIFWSKGFFTYEDALTHALITNFDYI